MRVLFILLNGSGPTFKVKDSEGRTGLGEVPGGEKITRTLRDAEPLIVGARVGDY